ncbi:hypothetical protein U1Q18_009065, partial [Sarracenia purpurea var. burkii]
EQSVGITKETKIQRIAEQSVDELVVEEPGQSSGVSRAIVHERNCLIRNSGVFGSVLRGFIGEFFGESEVFPVKPTIQSKGIA